MEQLKRNTPSTSPVRVVQFGEGNFLRAFIDWMIQKMNQESGFDGQVMIVQPIPSAGPMDMAQVINEQGGRYTLILRGFADGKPVQSREIIDCVNGCLNPYAQWAETMELLKVPTVRFVFSNTTEAGIEYKPEAYTPGKVQTTFPAKLAALTFERFKAGLPGLIFIPCELINHNGSTLRKYMLQYAADWNLPAEYSAWLNNECRFYNTLVDRIVAGYPREEAAQMEQELGYHDRLLDCGEIFHFFVLEGDPSLEDELPLSKSGLTVRIVADQSPYRTRKVRFLNGAHTADVPASIMGGLTFVDEMMRDADFGQMTRRCIYKEIAPTVQLPDSEKISFADSVVERFLNPFAHHRLMSISLNSVSKWKVRVLPSLKDFVEMSGKLPQALAFSLAALARFYRVDAAGQSKLGDVAWSVTDSPEVVAFFASIAPLSDAEYVRQMLAKTDFWDCDLNTIPGLTDFVTAKLALIEAKGIREAVRSILVD